jgi:hypothetical protein
MKFPLRIELAKNGYSILDDDDNIIQESATLSVEDEYVEALYKALFPETVKKHGIVPHWLGVVRRAIETAWREYEFNV